MTFATRPSKVSEADARRLSALISERRWVEARRLSNALLAQAPDNPVALTLAGQVALEAHEDARQAVSHFTRALEIAPDYWIALARLERAYWTLGDMEGATSAATRLIELDPDRGEGYYKLALLDPTSAATRVDAIARIAADASRRVESQVSALTALGLVHDHADRLDEAVEAFLAAKRRLGRPFHPELVAQKHARSAEAFTSDALKAAARRGAAHGQRLVFVIGLPRSGTTLIERILAAHPDVSDAGERIELFNILKRRFPSDCGVFDDPRGLADASAATLRAIGAEYLDAVRPFVREPEAPVWIDKLPGNYMQAGQAALLFPTARFVLTRREPRDVFVSCMRIFFSRGQGFTESFERFAEAYVLERAFAQLWRERLGERLIEVAYEDVARDVESQARRMIGHLGLDWRDECATPHRGGGVVRTASTMQVREPVHQRSIERWRRYEAQIAPLDRLLSAFEGHMSDAA